VETDAAARTPLVDVPFADHIDRRADSPEINGRAPDAIRVNEFTGEDTIIEKETHPGTKYSQEEIAHLREGARRRGFGFDLDTVDKDACPW